MRWDSDETVEGRSPHTSHRGPQEGSSASLRGRTPSTAWVRVSDHCCSWASSRGVLSYKDVSKDLSPDVEGCGVKVGSRIARCEECRNVTWSGGWLGRDAAQVSHFCKEKCAHTPVCVSGLEKCASAVNRDYFWVELFCVCVCNYKNKWKETTIHLCNYVCSIMCK